MVRADLVRAKLARAAAWLNDAETTLAKPAEEFLADRGARDLALFYLFLAIQESIDIAAHWLSDEGWTPPDDAGSSFDVLADHGVIPRELATSMRSASGLRNRIAHGYALLDYPRVHAESQDGLAALRGFLAAIAAASGA